MAQNHSYSCDHPSTLPAANSMSATLASSVAARRNTLVPLTLGRSADAIELLVPIAPAVHDATDLKARRAFYFLSDLLCQHAKQYSSAELIAACNHIPGSSYNANQEATTICSSLRAAFFTTTNLTDLGFLDPTLCGLMDTCGALNTGYLKFHLWLMSERPDLVAEFMSFDDANPAKPIKLGGAICDPSDFADHGTLTAVVRFYTPYTNVSGSPITLSFGLVSDVTVNTIFGLPMLYDLDSVIFLNSNSLHSRSLNLNFLITRAAAIFAPWTLPPLPAIMIAPTACTTHPMLP